MGLRVNTNVPSLTAQRFLKTGTDEQRKALGRLASGTRINRAGDDAAGLAISENLKSEIRSGTQAERNASDGISMVQTAEGGLNEVSGILIRLKELSVQSASDTLGNKERAFADLEFQNLMVEVDRIAKSTEFNGTNLLNGEGESLEFQIGTKNNSNLDRLTYSPANSNATMEKLGITGLTIKGKEEAQANMAVIDNAIGLINGNRASLGALQNRLFSTVNNMQVKNENLSEANSRIRDADVAIETSNLTRSNIITSASVSVLAQANSVPNQAMKLIG